jgi:hypothetical protein
VKTIVMARLKISGSVRGLKPCRANSLFAKRAQGDLNPTSAAGNFAP